jgi:uncharacterized protein YprB with RNaseH-like and TPR domain/predicted nuclease with RNAse H fold
MMTTASPPTETSVLHETFVHFEGIGAKTEQRLWRAGVHDWETLEHTPLGRRADVGRAIDRSRRALESGDLDYFFTALPDSERWRAYADFGPRFLALDIETTGLSNVYDEVTMIGIEREGEYRTYVRGANLDEAAEMLADAAGLITFNGALFDLPFISRTFPGLVLPSAHVDLRFLARRVGLSGSLKRIEHETELDRERTLVDIAGYEATVLWSEYDYEGRAASLRKLISYNAADTCVLRALADLVVARLYARLCEDREPPDEQQRLFDIASIPVARPRASARPVRPPAISSRGGALRVGAQRLALPKRTGSEPAVTIAGLHERMRDSAARIVGIDLSGSEQRPSGWALLEVSRIITGTLASTEEIVERTLACKPRLVSIDSPLGLPTGRDCTDDDCECRSAGITRECERMLRRRGVNVYPCLIPSMQKLTTRGIEIAAALRAEGVEVIESYPGAAQDIMRIPRKRASQTQLRAGLERFGLRGLRPSGQLTHDELDAATSAIVGAFYLADSYEALGGEEEGHLVIPTLTNPTTALMDENPPLGCATRDENASYEGLCMLIGERAREYAGALRDLDLLVGEDMEDYWRELGQHGARLRVASIEEPCVRLARRPRFVDLELHADDPRRARRLRTWAKQWS